MSTEHDFSPGSRQYLWLENDLRHVNRSTSPWVVFAGHRAMYCSEMYPSKFLITTDNKGNLVFLILFIMV